MKPVPSDRRPAGPWISPWNVPSEPTSEDEVRGGSICRGPLCVFHLCLLMFATVVLFVGPAALLQPGTASLSLHLDRVESTRVASGRVVDALRLRLQTRHARLSAASPPSGKVGLIGVVLLAWPLLLQSRMRHLRETESEAEKAKSCLATLSATACITRLASIYVRPPEPPRASDRRGQLRHACAPVPSCPVLSRPLQHITPDLTYAPLSSHVGGRRLPPSSWLQCAHLP